MICDSCNSDACLWDKSLKNTVCGACGGINTAVFEHTEACDNCQDQANSENP